MKKKKLIRFQSVRDWWSVCVCVCYGEKNDLKASKNVMKIVSLFSAALTNCQANIYIINTRTVPMGETKPFSVWDHIKTTNVFYTFDAKQWAKKNELRLEGIQEELFCK